MQDFIIFEDQHHILGRGPYSICYEGLQTSSGLSIVAKVMSNALSMKIQPVNLSIFQRTLNHPKIVQYLHIELLSGCVHIYLPKFESNLCQFLNAVELSEQELFKLLNDCLSGLHYLHSNSITHNAIKPENILIKEKTALLTDCGLYKSGQGYLHKVSHTWKAPEFFYKNEEDPKMSDIFCLGLVFL